MEKERRRQAVRESGRVGERGREGEGEKGTHRHFLMFEGGKPLDG